MNEGVREGCHAEADRQHQEERLNSLARHMATKHPRDKAKAWLERQKPEFREIMRARMNQAIAERKAAAERARATLAEMKKGLV